MKLYFSYGLVFFLLTLVAQNASSEQIKYELTTSKGRSVILYENKTWEYENQIEQPKSDDLTVTVREVVLNPEAFTLRPVSVKGNFSCYSSGVCHLSSPNGGGKIYVRATLYDFVKSKRRIVNDHCYATYKTCSAVVKGVLSLDREEGDIDMDFTNLVKIEGLE